MQSKCSHQCQYVTVPPSNIMYVLEFKSDVVTAYDQLRLKGEDTVVLTRGLRGMGRQGKLIVKTPDIFHSQGNLEINEVRVARHISWSSRQICSPHDQKSVQIPQRDRQG